jgi:rubrerythrin
MDAASQRMSEGIGQAIKAEVDGYHFYTMAARSTEDEQGRSVLLALAQDELEHVRFLKAQHAALLASGKPDEQIRLGPRAELKGTSPIFSAALLARAGEAHLEMSALSIGIQLELGAVEFYAGQAKAATHPTVRAFFEELADWERGHYQALLRQQEAMKDDYWAGGGFSPF